MKKQLIIVGIIFLLVCVGLSGCNEQRKINDDTSKFIGTWRHLEDNSTENLWTFYDNGTIKVVDNELYGDFHTNTSWGTFSVVDRICTSISYKVGDFLWENEMMCADYEFSNNDKTLTLTEDENSIVYTKQ